MNTWISSSTAYHLRLVFGNMNNSKFVFVIKEADLAMVEAYYQKILKEYDFPPSLLWIEITERCRLKYMY